MKNRKLLLPTIILAVAILTIAVYSIVSNIAFKPTVIEQEFPFSITYELDGETKTIRDVYKVKYQRNGGYADTKSRIYVGEIGNMGEGTTVYTLKQEENERIQLWTHLYPDYLMGDAWYDYFDNESFEPKIYYYDAQEQEFGDEETLLAHGVKLISYEYPTPIENSFVFSHISYCSGEVVLPTLIITLLALVAIIIFVRKEKELQYKAMDKISIILNFVVGFTLVPFVTIVAMFIDINGGGPELFRQILYFMPSILVMCIAASVALRRKGYGLKSLIVGLLGPIVFVLYLVVCGVLGL